MATFMEWDSDLVTLAVTTTQQLRDVQSPPGGKWPAEAGDASLKLRDATAAIDHVSTLMTSAAQHLRNPSSDSEDALARLAEIRERHKKRSAEAAKALLAKSEALKAAPNDDAVVKQQHKAKLAKALADMQKEHRQRLEQVHQEIEEADLRQLLEEIQDLEQQLEDLLELIAQIEVQIEATEMALQDLQKEEAKIDLDIAKEEQGIEDCKAEIKNLKDEEEVLLREAKDWDTTAADEMEKANSMATALELQAAALGCMPGAQQAAAALTALAHGIRNHGQAASQRCQALANDCRGRAASKVQEIGRQAQQQQKHEAKVTELTSKKEAKTKEADVCTAQLVGLKSDLADKQSQLTLLESTIDAKRAPLASRSNAYQDCRAHAQSRAATTKRGFESKLATALQERQSKVKQSVAVAARSR